MLPKIVSLLLLNQGRPPHPKKLLLSEQTHRPTPVVVWNGRKPWFRFNSCVRRYSSLSLSLLCVCVCYLAEGDNNGFICKNNGWSAAGRNELYSQTKHVGSIEGIRGRALISYHMLELKFGSAGSKEKGRVQQNSTDDAQRRLVPRFSSFLTFPPLL